MNRKIMQGNAEFRRQPLTGEALAGTIKNCKTTEIGGMIQEFMLCIYSGGLFTLIGNIDL